MGHAGQTFPLIDPNSCCFSRPPRAARLPGVEAAGSFRGAERIRLTHLGLYSRMLTLWAPCSNSLLAGHARTHSLPPSSPRGRWCLHGVPSYGARTISPPLSLQHRLCAVLLLAGVNKVEHLPNICSCLLCVLPNRRAGSSTTPGPKCQGLSATAQAHCLACLGLVGSPGVSGGLPGGERALVLCPSPLSRKGQYYG